MFSVPQNWIGGTSGNLVDLGKTIPSDTQNLEPTQSERSATTMGMLEDVQNTSNFLKLTYEDLKSSSSSHTTFFSQCLCFISLADQLNCKFKELNIKFNELSKQEKDIQQRTDELEWNREMLEQKKENLRARENDAKIREDNIKERENNIKERENKVLARENKCTRREWKIEEASRQVAVMVKKWAIRPPTKFKPKTRTPITLRVRDGTLFHTSKELLLQFKDSRFAKLIAENDHELAVTSELYMDRDPIYFAYMLGCMNRVSMGEPFLPPPQSLTLSQSILFQQEFNYFSLAEMPMLLLEFINKEWFPYHEFQCLYKATRDGFAASEFHRLCDDKGSTLTLITSTEGYVFGGYSILPWDSSREFKDHTEGFLFTLINPHNIPPTIYHHISRQSTSILCNSLYGPSFGLQDIHVKHIQMKPKIILLGFPIITSTPFRGKVIGHSLVRNSLQRLRFKSILY